MNLVVKVALFLALLNKINTFLLLSAKNNDPPLKKVQFLGKTNKNQPLTWSKENHLVMIPLAKEEISRRRSSVYVGRCPSETIRTGPLCVDYIVH